MCIFILVSCSEKPASELTAFQLHQKEQHEFMLSNSSPLPEEERKNFIALNYFPQNDSFNVQAEYRSVFNGGRIEFETNTERRPKYIHYGNVVFMINDKLHKLHAYKQESDTSKSLFVPFNDLSNGKSTYHSGRYLDITIPNSNSFNLNFNLAYNPYCAYNKKYSCPIPPMANRLDISINAGEKKYH